MLVDEGSQNRGQNASQKERNDAQCDAGQPVDQWQIRTDGIVNDRVMRMTVLVRWNWRES